MGWPWEELPRLAHRFLCLAPTACDGSWTQQERSWRLIGTLLNKSISLPSWGVTRSTALIPVAPSMLSISTPAWCMHSSRWALRFHTLPRRRYPRAAFLWVRLRELARALSRDLAPSPHSTLQPD